MPFNHVVVWLDRIKAHVLHFNKEACVAEAFKAHPLHPHLHTNSHDSRAENNSQFYDNISNSLADAREILVVGPGQEKLTFRKHLDKHHPAMAANIVGVETVDHPSDGQLLAYARKYFHNVDFMR